MAHNNTANLKGVLMVYKMHRRSSRTQKCCYVF